MSDALPFAPPDTRRPGSRALRKFLNNRMAVFGAILAGFFILLALFAPFIAGEDPYQTNFTALRKPPSPQHWLGTDELGRDLFARMAYGARTSLLAGGVSALIAALIGVPFGVAAGYFGGWTDMVIARLIDATLAIPFLILAIALAAFLGPSLTNAMIAIGLSAAPIFARLTRGQVMAVRTEEYVEAAIVVGLRHPRIIWRYILPNALPPIIVQATLTIAMAIVAEASLSFLGLGQQPPIPSWGSMLNTAKNFISQAAWMSIWPGVAIFLVVLGFSLLGDGLRDAMDPHET